MSCETSRPTRKCIRRSWPDKTAAHIVTRREQGGRRRKATTGFVCMWPVGLVARDVGMGPCSLRGRQSPDSGVRGPADLDCPACVTSISEVRKYRRKKKEKKKAADVVKAQFPDLRKRSLALSPCLFSAFVIPVATPLLPSAPSEMQSFARSFLLPGLAGRL